jgi:serine/threonine-protein kinase SRPK3
MTAVLRSLTRWSRLGRWRPLKFDNPNFARIPSNQAIEEENIPDYVASRYYPVRIGEVFRDRYQVVGKLGFGASSTAWLARDMEYDASMIKSVLVHKITDFYVFLAIVNT